MLQEKGSSNSVMNNSQLTLAKTGHGESVPQITHSKLESQLWEAANILRGPVAAADLKTYVFPLPFLSAYQTCMTKNIKPPCKNLAETSLDER